MSVNRKSSKAGAGVRQQCLLLLFALSPLLLSCMAIGPEDSFTRQTVSSLPLSLRVSSLLESDRFWQQFPDYSDRAGELKEAMASADAERFFDSSQDEPADAALDEEPDSIDDRLGKVNLVGTMALHGEVRTGVRVLEVGTGSGFAAAVYSELGADVSSIEIVCEKADAARLRLKRLGYDEVKVRCGDGLRGWEERAPFDLILVNVKAKGISDSLLKQLSPKGKIIAPLAFATSGLAQLLLVERSGKDLLTERLSSVNVERVIGPTSLPSAPPSNAISTEPGQDSRELDPPMSKMPENR